VIYEEARQDELSPVLLGSHIDFLRDLSSKGVLSSCGPLKDSNGKALLILDTDSKEDAERHIAKDPFIRQRWYERYNIYEWIEANESNNFLMP